jgi:uncharacterized SAM-binding protein YcdF (DUF218 family)
MAAVWGGLHRAAIMAAGVLLLWLLGLIWFVQPPPVESRAGPTDAIVVLTGGSLRIQSGIELLREGKGRKLFVSGVNQQVALDDVLRVSGSAPDWALCCVVLGHEADNTRENADETARWMRSQGFHSLRLVTSWYHMPRSLLEFQRAMPDVEILAHPVFPERVKQEHWWAWRDTTALLMIEYVKYLRALLRPAVEWMQPATSGTLGPAKAEMRR